MSARWMLMLAGVLLWGCGPKQPDPTGPSAIPTTSPAEPPGPSAAATGDLPEASEASPEAE